MDALMERLRGLPPVDADEPVQVAGDQQYKDYAERKKIGIPLTKALYEEVREVCKVSGAAFILGR